MELKNQYNENPNELRELSDIELTMTACSLYEGSGLGKYSSKLILKKFAWNMTLWRMDNSYWDTNIVPECTTGYIYKDGKMASWQRHRARDKCDKKGRMCPAMQ